MAPAEARITLDSTKLTGAYATRAEVGGTVTWKAADGTWKPVPAGSPVRGESLGAVTNGAGRFALSAQFLGDGAWSVGESSGWLTAPSRRVQVDTTAGTLLRNPTATVRSDKTVRVGAFFDRGEIPAGTTSLKVEVQYSADGTTGWTTSAVKIFRTETAIPRFDATPEPVKKGKPLTLKGKLTHSAPDWYPFAGQSVQIYFRPKGYTTWLAMGESTTAHDGTFTKTYTASATGSWTARYEQADAFHFTAASRIDEVIVNQ
ncbi:hypothetical protein ACFYYB_17780 [Streptomyces sp. NPDC002886]|uniref:hypothetical protein n=1 Tax=Streptomyces sp. NPDC002886 TaxID=3364667 RepID=UPI0036A15970